MSTHILLLEVAPVLLRLNHKPLESVWITHCDCGL